MALFRKTIEKLTAGLSRTREKFVGSLKSLLSGRSLSEDLLCDLEGKLIEADMGVSTAVRICDDLRAAYEEKRIAKGDDVVEFLKAELKEYWPQSDRATRDALAKTGIPIPGLEAERVLGERRVRREPEGRTGMMDPLDLPIRTLQHQWGVARRGDDGFAGDGVEQAVRSRDEQARAAAFVQALFLFEVCQRGRSRTDGDALAGAPK